MVLLFLILLFFVFSLAQLLRDNGVNALRDFSFWLIMISFVAIASFVYGGINA